MTTSQRILAVFWISAGLNHFRVPRLYESIMPDYVPAHRELVLISGVAEIIGGAAVIPAPARRFARWWLLGVLAAVYPANVHMTLHPERYERIPPVALWARLPLQFLCAWWVWRATKYITPGRSSASRPVCPVESQAVAAGSSVTGRARPHTSWCTRRACRAPR